MKTTNIKTLAAALAAIISVGVLSSCTANTAQTNPEPSETTVTTTTTSQTTTEQPQTTSAKETTTPSSTKPETQTKKTTAPTNTAPSTAAPATTAAASTTKPVTASTAPVSTTAPAPEWTESAVSGTRYVNTAGIYSRSKAVLGAPTVKQYSLNDAVTVVAVTNTGYYKLSDGSFIHADYLGADRVTAQTASTTKPSTSSAAPTVSKPAATTKAQSSTTKPASTTKKQSTTTPSSGSSQSGGDRKGYDMDDPDFPWDEYFKETDGGGSGVKWDDLFGNMTMPWEDEKESECVTEWRNMSDAEREEIKSELIDRIGYYLSKEMGCTETPIKGLCNYTCAVAKFDGNDEKAIKYTNYDINKKGNYLIAVGTGEELYSFTNEEIDLCAKNIVEMFASVSLPLWKSYDGYEDFKYFGISVNLQEYSDNLGTHIATGPLYLYISNVNTDNYN